MRDKFITFSECNFIDVSPFLEEKFDIIIFKSKSINSKWANNNYVENGYNFYNLERLKELYGEKYNEVSELEIIDTFKEIGNIKYVPIDILKRTMYSNSASNFMDRTIVFVMDSSEDDSYNVEQTHRFYDLFLRNNSKVMLWDSVESIDDNEKFTYISPITNNIRVKEVFEEMRSYNSPVFICTSSTSYNNLYSIIKEHVVVNCVDHRIFDIFNDYNLCYSSKENSNKLILDGSHMDMLVVKSELVKNIFSHISIQPTDYMYDYILVDKKFSKEKNILWYGDPNSKLDNFEIVVKLATEIKKLDLKNKIFISVDEKDLVFKILEQNKVLDVFNFIVESEELEYIEKCEYLMYTSKKTSSLHMINKALESGSKLLIDEELFLCKEFYSRFNQISFFKNEHEVIFKLNEKKNQEKYKKQKNDFDYYCKWQEIIAGAIKNRLKR